MQENKPVIYQMLPRLFGNTVTTNKTYGTIEENGVGKFNDITNKALKELRKLGVTHVWYTGVIEHATMTDYSDYGIKRDNPEVVKGRAGSPYAIKDYFDVDPDLAVEVNNRMKEFENLIDRTHSNGLKVIIDFVPNHVAREYYSDSKPANVEDLGANDDTSVGFDPDNNFYYILGEEFVVPEGYHPFGGGEPFEVTYYEKPAKVSGNNIFSPAPSVHDWFETVKLNYGIDYRNGEKEYFEPVPDTWHKMVEILKFWAEKEIDGFRCDMVQMVPVEFWEWAIPQVKEENPDLIFIAEIYVRDLYEKYLERGRFDYLYDKVQLYDTLKNIVKGKGSSDNIAVVEEDLSAISERMLRFLENHDEQRLASPYFADDPFRAWPAMVVTAVIGNGPVMIYFGQEVGEPGAGEEGFQGDDGRTTIFDYWGVPLHQQWVNDGKYDGTRLTTDQQRLRAMYQRLLILCNSESAIYEGSFTDLNAINRNDEVRNYSNKIGVFLRRSTDQALMVVANFSDSSEAVIINIPPNVLKAINVDPETGLRDILNEEPAETMMKSGQIELDLMPFSAYIFEFNP